MKEKDNLIKMSQCDMIIISYDAEERRKMKVLVTGGGGYIGKHVVKKFLDEGHDVYVVDLKAKELDGRAKRITEPIFSGDENIYEKLGRPDVLIHLAWRGVYDHNSSTHLKDLPKHVKFLQDMINGGLKYLTVMGTMHEVGYWEGMINEDTPCNPMTMYGIAKNALRQAMMLYTKDKDVNFHWLRAYYSYGDDGGGGNIFGKLYEANEKGQEEFPFTTGKNKLDFIHVDKLMEQIYRASLQSDINGIIEVCTGEPKSLAEQVEQFMKDKNMTIKLKYGVFPDRPYDSPCVYGDATKIKAIMAKES